MKTGEMKPHQTNVMLMPCAPDKCQECATDHDPVLPHNQQSLFYQYKFYDKTGRWPTWKDAMSHCTEAMQKAWTEQLAKLGIDVEAKTEKEKPKKGKKK